MRGSWKPYRCPQREDRVKSTVLWACWTPPEVRVSLAGVGAQRRHSVIPSPWEGLASTPYHTPTPLTLPTHTGAGSIFTGPVEKGRTGLALWNLRNVQE